MTDERPRERAEEEPEPPATARVPTAHDWTGPRDYIEVPAGDIEAVQDWDDRLWHR